MAGGGKFLSRYHIEVVYKPGKDNTVADGLSRWAYPAGLADDTDFHGSDADQKGVMKQECELKEREDNFLAQRARDTQVHFDSGLLNAITAVGHDSNIPERRVVRLLCCVATCFILFQKVYKIFDATLQNFRLTAFKKTVHTFFSQSRSDSGTSFLGCGSVALVCDYNFPTKDDDF